MGRKNKRHRGKVFHYQGGKMVEVKKEKADVPKASAKTPTYTMSDISLVIPDLILNKIMHWMNKADFEVSGFGSLDWDEKTKTFTVRDVILLKQEVGTAMTEIDPTSLGKAMFRMKDEPNALKWHWHSHVDMGVFWSPDDRELIAQLGTQGWILASVFNRKREVKTAFCTRTEIMGYIHDAFFDDLKTTVSKEVDPSLVAQWDKEYDDNVKAKTFSPRTYEGYNKQPMLFDEAEFYDRRWSSNQFKKLYPIDYDTDGYCKVDDTHWVYNPLHDRQVHGDHAAMSMVEEMDQEEIEFLRVRDDSFEKLVQRYLTEKAKDNPSQAERERLMSIQGEDHELNELGGWE